MSVVSVVCCQVEVSATNWSLVRRSPTECGASVCVTRNLGNEVALAHWGVGAVAPKTNIFDRCGLITSKKKNSEIDRCISKRFQEQFCTRKWICCAVHLCELQMKADLATCHNGIAGLHKIVALKSSYPFVGNWPDAVLTGRLQSHVPYYCESPAHAAVSAGRPSWNRLRNNKFFFCCICCCCPSLVVTSLSPPLPVSLRP